MNHPVSEHSQIQTGEDKEINPWGDETTAASHLGADWLQTSVWEGHPFFLTGESWRAESRWSESFEMEHCSWDGGIDMILVYDTWMWSHSSVSSSNHRTIKWYIIATFPMSWESFLLAGCLNSECAHLSVLIPGRKQCFKVAKPLDAELRWPDFDPWLCHALLYINFRKLKFCASVWKPGM